MAIREKGSLVDWMDEKAEEVTLRLTWELSKERERILDAVD